LSESGWTGGKACKGVFVKCRPFVNIENGFELKPEALKSNIPGHIRGRVIIDYQPQGG
jgi:hypothetical protein